MKNYFLIANRTRLRVHIVCAVPFMHTSAKNINNTLDWNIYEYQMYFFCANAKIEKEKAKATEGMKCH